MWPLIERAVRVVRDRGEPKGVTVMIQPMDKQPLIADVDALAIEQILIDLLMNAIDAAGHGSTVIVGAFAVPDELRIEVTDEGTGIDLEHRERIFDPYFTTKENGTGLGLAVSREIACHHGGTLEFTSDERGTTFVLHLPSLRGPA